MSYCLDRAFELLIKKNMEKKIPDILLLLHHTHPSEKAPKRLTKKNPNRIREYYQMLSEEVKKIMDGDNDRREDTRREIIDELRGTKEQFFTRQWKYLLLPSNHNQEKLKGNKPSARFHWHVPQGRDNLALDWYPNSRYPLESDWKYFNDTWGIGGGDQWPENRLFFVREFAFLLYKRHPYDEIDYWIVHELINQIHHIFDFYIKDNIDITYSNKLRITEKAGKIIKMEIIKVEEGEDLRYPIERVDE